MKILTTPEGRWIWDRHFWRLEWYPKGKRLPSRHWYFDLEQRDNNFRDASRIAASLESRRQMIAKQQEEAEEEERNDQGRVA